MIKNIGPLDRSIPPYAEMTLNGRHITHHMDVLDFPEQAGARSECIKHLDDGHAADMMDDFMIGGSRIPELNELPEIRTAFVCSGPTMFKRCQLRLLQAKADGEVISETPYQ